IACVASSKSKRCPPPRKDVERGAWSVAREDSAPRATLHAPRTAMTPLAEAACELPWLAPCAGSLVALTRSASGRLWPMLRSDPGLVLLLLRQATPAVTASALSFYPSLLNDPGVLQLALDCLPAAEGGFVDWTQPTYRPIYRAALAYALTAEAIALRTDRCDADHAWVGGLLAPLGWLAVAPKAPAKAPDAEATARLQQQH